MAGEAALLVTSCDVVAVGGPGEAVLVNVVGTGECRPAQAPGTSARWLLTDWAVERGTMVGS